MLGLLGCSQALQLPHTAVASMVQRTRGVAIQAMDGGYNSDPLMPTSDFERAEIDAKLDRLADKWEEREEDISMESGKQLGWAQSSEQVNGRLAMFFLLTGLVTEYYTGQSLPQQVGTMLETLGVTSVRPNLVEIML